MLISSWLSSLQSTLQRRSRSAARRSRKLASSQHVASESLEDRVLLTLVAQFDASTLALPNNTVVSSWGGQTATGTPTYLTGQTPNGSPAVQFNAGGDRMGNNVALSPSAAGDWIVAAVVRANNIGGYHNLVDDDAQNTPMLWIDNGFRYEMNGGGGGARGVGTGTGGWDIVIADSRLNQLYVNSNTANATGGAASAFTVAETFDFFHRDGGETYQGLVAELRVYNDRADFGGDFAALRASLAAKWFAATTPQPPTVNLSVSAATGTEVGTTAITVTATSSFAVSGNQTVTLGASGTNITAGDYTLSNSTITILDGQTAGSVTFTVTDDMLVEAATETATLTISNPSSGISLGTTTSQDINIADNDSATLSITANDGSAGETGTNNGQYTVSLSKASSTNTVVSYSVGGTAEGTADYSSAALTGSVTILAGNTTATIDVSGIVDDAIVEADETVIVTLTSFSGNPQISLPATGVRTYSVKVVDKGNNFGVYGISITTDGTLGPITPAHIVSYSMYVATRYSGITLTPANSTLTETFGTGAELIATSTGIQWRNTAVVGGTAGRWSFESINRSYGSLGNLFYTSPTTGINAASGNVFWQTPDFVSTQTGIGTAGSEYAIAGVYGAPDPNPANRSATVTIADNDSATVSFTANDASAGETATNNGQYTVSLTKVSSTNTVVNYSVTGTATATTDYTALTGSVTIPAGSLSATINVSGIVDDAIVEADETVIVTLTSVSGDPQISLAAAAADKTATVTIADNDSATLSLAANDASASETGSNNGQYTVSLSQASSTNTVVSYSVGGTATATTDYTALTGSVTIPAGSLSATINVSGILDDLLVEADETVIVTLTSFSGDPQIVFASAPDQVYPIAVFDKGNATAVYAGTITTDGTLGVITTANIRDYSISYSTRYASGQVTLANSTIFTGDGTGWELIATTSGIQWNNKLVGGTGSSWEFRRDALPFSMVTYASPHPFSSGYGNVSWQTTETWTQLGVFGAYAIAGVVGVPEPGPVGPRATVTIADNDSATVSLAATDAVAGETASNSGQFTVSLTKVSSTNTVVNYSLAGSTAAGTTDYTALTGSVTILAGSSSAVINVSGIVDDLLVEGDETVIVTLTGVSGDPQISLAAAAADKTATVTITDNDSATLSLAANDASAGETATNNGQFRVSLTKVSSTTTLVNYSLGGTAAATTDYTALTGSVTIPAGSLSAVIDVSGIVNDTLVERDETVIVTLTTFSGNSQISLAAAADLTATVTIADNDSATLSITANDGSAGETPVNNGQYTVSLSQPSSTDTVVSYSVAGTSTGTTDYTALTGSVTILAGNTSAVIDVTGIVDDLIVEGDETVIVTLTSFSGNPQISLAAAAADLAATVTIGDNDSATVSIAATDASAGETATSNGQFTVSLTQASATDTVVNYSVAGTATGTTDYTTLTGSVTILAGNTLAVIDVSGIVDDLIVEGDETVIVTLTSLSGNSQISLAAAAADLTATVTIADNDSATLSITATDASAGETAGNNGQFTVSLSKASSTDTVVSYSVGGTATAADYNSAALTGSVTILAGNTTATIDVSGIVDDAIVEANETVIVTLTSFSGNPQISLPATGVRTYSVKVVDKGNNFGVYGISITTDGTLGPITPAHIVSYSMYVATRYSGITLTPANSTLTETFGTGAEMIATSTGIQWHNTAVVGGTAGRWKFETIDETYGSLGILTYTSPTTGIHATSGNVFWQTPDFVSTQESIGTAGSEYAIAGVYGAPDPNPANRSATVTIADNDSAVISINAPSATEGTALGFSISISNPVDVAVTANRATQDGTATTADSDYTAIASGNVTLFAAGSTTAFPVSVSTTTDSKMELNETLNLLLSALAAGGRAVTFNGGGSTLSGSGTITNDDTAVDNTAPTATVRSLPLTTTTSPITLTIDTNDPAGAVGDPISGVASYDVYVAVDSGAWTLFADDVPATQSTVNFTPTSNHRFWFRAVAKDNSGNVEVEPTTPVAEANTRTTDVEGPNTAVVSATVDANGSFTLNLQGRDVGGSTVSRFRVFVKIDDGAAVEIPQTNINAGAANGSGVHSATTNYQGLRDGVAHSYTFFTRGIDSANNLEAAPTDANADIRQTHTFAAPAALAATDIDVQNGQTQRSYIRNVDVLFNDVNGLQSLFDNNRIRVERFDLLDSTPDVGTGASVSISGATVNGNSIKLDFGAGGLGGVGRAGNGFYRILVDTNGDNTFNDSMFEFFRLYGDSNGDGKVTSADGTVTEDLTGDGLVNATDRSIWRSERSFKLLDDLFAHLDD